jgi:polar amino acid transport system substrate-binding protein
MLTVTASYNETLSSSKTGANWCLSLAFIFVFLSLRPASATDLKAYTEEWPPYNFMVGNEIKGISVEILQAACVRAKLSCEFQIVPWARAYKTVSETPHTVVFTIARTKSRESQFFWVGPILPRTIWIYGRPELATTVRNLKDLANTRIGVVRSEAAYDELVAAGVPLSAILVTSSNDDAIKSFIRGGINAVANTEIGMAWNLSKFDRFAPAVVKLLRLNSEVSYYFALNLKTDPEIVKRLQASIDRLRQEGKIDAVVRKYAIQQ